MSSAVVRPSTRSASDAITAPPWMIARISSARSVPQSSSMITASCDDVDEAAGQVTRVRRLERRVGQTLAGAVGRVEIFKDGQAFLEVRDDRRLDDLARRLGHQAAHAGKLLDLRLRTTSARVGHHVDRVDRLLAAVLALRRGRDFLHHLGRDLVAATRPGVDHLVVLFLLGDQAVLILLLIVLHQRAGLVDQRHLGGRDDHVVLAEARCRP